MAAQRVVVLDTETTGFSADLDRVIEVAAVEVDPRTGEAGAAFHELIDPLRPIPWGATKVHGVRDADVRGKPTIGAIADRFGAFVDGATVAIHNSSFDVRMLDAEFARLGRRRFSEMNVSIVDTVTVARELMPFLAHHSLDALCDALGVDRGERVRHGALLDAKLTGRTLPHLARAYDELLGHSAKGCGAVEPPALLGEIIDDALASVDVRTPGAAEVSLCNLATLERAFGDLARRLHARWEADIALDDWCCMHFIARSSSSSSESNKAAAAALLDPGALSAYESPSHSTILSPLQAGTLDMRMTLAEQLIGGASPHEIVRDIVAVDEGLAQIREARGAVRDSLLKSVAEGYAVQRTSYCVKRGTRIDYKRALRDLAPGADLTPYTSARTKQTFRARRLTPCSALFGQPKKRVRAA